ncbi:MAG: SGNH/GDSL hydrolase family protein [Pseudomonadota bacterium]|nr:SGNH/GDSL hydrolase family protein [Pseudomonadota bacterium]
MKLKTSAAAAALIAGALLAHSASAQTYGRLIAFGDSLSDSGNTFRASRGTNPPSPPYFNGRFSNGPTFVELLGFQPLGLFGTTTGNVNNAFGGAETVGPGTFGVPSLRQQFEGYVAAGGRFGSGDLVSVLGGANNILNAFPRVALGPNPAGGISAVAVGAASDIGQLTGRIAAAGAGTILVTNLPDIGATPAFNAGPAAPLASLGVATFNGALAANLQAVAAASPGANIILFDISRLDPYVRSRPGDFGLTNVTQPCLNTATGQVCATPDTFYYWDSVHPTAATSRLFAVAALDYLYYGTRGAAAATIGETGLEHREGAHSSALDMLEEAHEAAGVRFALELEGARSEEDARDDVPEVERETGALRVAVDGKIGPDLTLGVLLSAAESQVDAGALRFEGASYGADLYLGLSRGNGFANIVFGGSADEYTDYARATGVGPVTHDADRISGSSYGGKLQAGLRLPFGGGTLSPRGALSVLRTEVESFNENGPVARQAHGRHEIEAVGGEASLRFEPEFGGGYKGHIEAGYGDFLSYDGDVQTALVDNTARALVTEVEDPGRGAILDAGVRGPLIAGLELGVSYRGRFDDGSSNHAAMLTVSVRR